MNRIETRIVIMITNRLSSAKDSDAKMEMIEELSENLYQRYLELTAEEMPEEEALQKAMDSLGDVEELLAFLKEEEAEDTKYRTYHEEENINGKENSHRERGSSFFKGDLESGIEEIMNAAFSTARVAVDCARDVAKDVSDQIKEKYPDGVFQGFSSRRGQKVDCTSISPKQVQSLEVRLTNGSIKVNCKEEEDTFIEILGDTDEIVTVLKEDGVLSVGQGNTASAAYLFMRGMRRSDIEVRLPKKIWKKIGISTVNGDIEISGIYEACELFSASGSIVFCGESREANCSSTSGNVRLHLEKLPERAECNSVSGKCKVQIPKEEGFCISYQTVSGKFMTDFSLSGTVGEKNGNAVYGENTSREIHISSVSGDIELFGIE